VSEIVYNLASSFPVGAYIMGKVIEKVLADGYDRVSVLPTWGTPSANFEFKACVRCAEMPWNPGTPWGWAYGLITHSLKTPRLHDWLLFPWYKKWWMPLWERIIRWGAMPIVHSFHEAPGLVEINPNMRINGEVAVVTACLCERMLVFDTHHAVRDLLPGTLQPGESAKSLLGDWREWLGPAVRMRRLGMFDFHTTTLQLATNNMDEPLAMLRFALDEGYAGPIRVEAVLPGLINQVKNWRETSRLILELLRDELGS